MSSSYSTSLGLELIGSGEQSGTWGITTNTNLGTLVEQAITGVQSITMTTADYTLTTNQGVVNEARNAVIVVGGTPGSGRNVIIPGVKKVYIFTNNTSGGNSIGVKTSGGSTTPVPNGASLLIYCDGTNTTSVAPTTAGTTSPTAFTGFISGTELTVNSVIQGSLVIGQTLYVPLGVSGFTANTTITAGVSSPFTVSSSQTVGSSINPVTFVAIRTPTQIATVDYVQNKTYSVVLNGIPTAPTAAPGTNTTQIATTAFVITNGFPSGGIILWSGSILSVPLGFQLCDGTNGTPDLRNRFVVGAGSTYNVNATGGSANAIVVSHTHTASTSTHSLTGSFTALNRDGAAAANRIMVARSGVFTSIEAGGNFGEGWQGGAGSQSSRVNFDGTHSHTVTNSTEGVSGTNANLPPYFALAYIMKL